MARTALPWMGLFFGLAVWAPSLMTAETKNSSAVLNPTRPPEIAEEDLQAHRSQEPRTLARREAADLGGPQSRSDYEEAVRRYGRGSPEAQAAEQKLLAAEKRPGQ